MKKVLTKEEQELKDLKKAAKTEKKLYKRYTLFRYNKLVTFILLGVFVACTVCFGLGMRTLNATDVMTEEGNPIEIGVTILLAVGGVGFGLIPFFIFRRFSLVAILIGVAFWDAGIVFQGMTLEGESFILGGCLVLYGVVALLIGERRRNKQKENHKLNLNQDLLESMITHPNADKMLDALQYASYNESTYKASLYFTLSLMLVAMTGIGLVLPFGKWSYNYNKCLYFQTSEWDLMPEGEKPSKEYRGDKPYACIFDGLIYVDGKPFYAVKENGVCSYKIRARASMWVGCFYLFVSSFIYEMNTKRQSFVRKMNASLGELMFSGKDIRDIDEQSAELFINYATNQSEETKQELLAGLDTWYNASQAANRAELERIERYESERDRVNSKYATETPVYTDGDNLYIKGHDVAGNKKQYKLEEYDEKTGVGSYTDESGKKVKIKNDD